MNEIARIAVIGGGFGGFTAAIRAAQLGAEVTLIEKDKLGGTCLNVGCIPTKVLLEGARRLADLKTMRWHGIKIEGFFLDLAALMERKDRIIASLVGKLKEMLDDNRVRVLKGRATLTSPHRVRVELNDGGREEIEATGVIVATGSVPASIEGLEDALTSEEALSLTEVPKSLAIVGGGVIGVEFASIFSAFGSKVTIVESLPRILSTEDVDVSKGVAWLLEQRGVDILTSSQVMGMDGDELVVLTEGGERRLRAEKVLVAVGRKPYTGGLDLEAVGVRTQEAILVNEHMETNVPGIYAVGDVTGKYFLAHVASAQGKVAAENAMGYPTRMDYSVIPRCIFTVPEVAAVGLTEDEARAQGYEVAVGILPLTSSEMAVIKGQTEGFIKVVAAEGRLLGMHIIGPEASSLIMEGAMAIGSKLEEITSFIHPHPTLSEALQRAIQVTLRDS